MKSTKINFRVTYAETDQMKVVYYSNYFIWFEKGRTEYFRNIGIPYTDLENEGIYVPVVEAYCRYSSSARYDDLIEVYTRIRELKKATITFEYEIKRDGVLLATGHTVHAFVNNKSRPVKVPEKLTNKIIDWYEHSLRRIYISCKPQDLKEVVI
ncbi:acyl-CoA thioesterase, partial [Candidatus Desantisbacteria bacterium]|nr:acyl-CoA thioesterase [Candidatus Desantisbacteria bacterium]